jgi:N-acetylmuramoyl-L-alanine amidase
MRIVLKLVILCILVLPAAASASEKGLVVKGVRYSSYAAFTRVVFEIEAAAPYVLTKTEDGRSLMLTAYEGPLAVKSSLPTVRDGVVSGLEVKEEARRTYLMVHLDGAAGEVKDFVLRGPDRIVLDISRGVATSTAVHAGRLTVIVLDPGHGGRESGIVTAQGYEKTFTLDLAHEIKKNLQKNARLKVILTREKDLALSLDDRAAFSKAVGATIFVSVHGAPGKGAQVLIQDLMDDAGTDAPPSASGDFIGFEAVSEQQEMLWGRQQAAHARESGDLGRMLARQLMDKELAEAVQVPLAGLKSVDAAAVMVEVGMEQDRSRTAEAVAGGIEHYARESR